VTAEQLLSEIADYCRRVGMAESTFGRRAVNDGKLVSRLRIGGRVTMETVERVRTFMSEHRSIENPRLGAAPSSVGAWPAPECGNGSSRDPACRSLRAKDESKTNFRFYDNRQKYLLFVNTCSESGWSPARRHGAREYSSTTSRGQGFRCRCRRRHRARPRHARHAPALSDDAFLHRRQGNQPGGRASRSRPHAGPLLRASVDGARHDQSLLLGGPVARAEIGHGRHQSRLEGGRAHWSDLERVRTADHRAPAVPERALARVGEQDERNPAYAKPVVLVFYREDHKFLLDQVLPRRGVARADYDLVIASQPYRARASAEFKASKVLAPLARSLAPGGRMNRDPFPRPRPGAGDRTAYLAGRNPFQTDRHSLLKATRAELGADGRDLNFNAYADNRSIFRYEMHTLPEEISDAIGTSTLLAAWNARRLRGTDRGSTFRRGHGGPGLPRSHAGGAAPPQGLWFLDES